MARKGSAESNKFIIYEVLGAIIILIIIVIFASMFFGAFPQKAVASAKVVCFATNSVYGNQPSGGWVSASQINKHCEKKTTSASMTGAITGTLTGFASTVSGTGKIAAICAKGKYGAPPNMVGCRIANFELPQRSKTGLVKKYVPGWGDPDYVLYYGDYPKITAEAAWGNWAAFNLITTVMPVGKLAKGGEFLLKGSLKVAEKLPVIKTGAKAVVFAGKAVKPGAKLALKAGEVITEKAGRLGFKAGEEVYRSVRYWIEWVGNLGYDKLSGKTIGEYKFVTGPVGSLADKDAGEMVKDASDQLIKVVDGTYEFNLKAFVYLLHRNGVRMFDDVSGKAMVKYLGPDGIGKIDAAAQKRALQSIDGGDYRLVQVLVGEREVPKNVQRMGDLVIADDIANMPLSAAKKMEGTMGLGPGEKALVLTPKFLLIKKGTQTIDNVVGLTKGSGDECTFTLRKQTASLNPVKRAKQEVQKSAGYDEMKFTMSNCKNNNVNNLRTNPSNDDTKTGVALHEFTLKESDLPSSWISVLFGGDRQIYAAKTGFYAASPCLSQGSGRNGDERDVIGPSKYFRIYPGKDGVVKEISGYWRVQAQMPIATTDYSPNFCYQYPISDIADWPIIDQITNIIETTTGVSIQEFDLGLAPWPCHGTLILGDLGDAARTQLYKYDLGWIVPKLFGTCGGAQSS